MVKQILQNFLQHPLVHFFVLGVLVFISSALFNDNSKPVIRITENEIAKISSRFKLQWRRPPTKNELQKKIKQFIEEEILYREAISMGIDNGDSIIRRRMIQKITFLAGDTQFQEAPTDSALQSFYEQNQDSYRTAKTVDFEHIFFAFDRSGTAYHAAVREKLKLLLENSKQNSGGDPYIHKSNYVAVTQSEVGQLYGEEFARRLFQLSIASWQGPIDSVYGAHLIRLLRKQPQRVLPFNQVKDNVLQDFERYHHQQSIASFIGERMLGYDIVIEAPVDFIEEK